MKTDPREIAKLYERAHDLASLAMTLRLLPRDIDATWANTWGMLRRIPGQPYHRPPPAGRGLTSESEAPTEQEVASLRHYFLVSIARIERVLDQDAKSRKE